MRVRIYPADEGACSFYRLREPMRATSASGLDVAEGRPFDIEGVVQSNGLKIPRRVTFDEPQPDVVVLQRVTSRELCEAIPVLQRQGVAVVVEIDDDLHVIPAGHPYLRDTSILSGSERSRRWMRRAAEMADVVTCSTPALAARYGTAGNAIVVPNLIPQAWLDLPLPDHGLVYGWTGSTITHVDDLRVTGGAVAQVLTRTGGSFRVVGTGVGVPEQLGLAEGQRIEATGWVDLDRYPSAYRTISTAIVPLQLNAFNEAKSWLKGLEAAALGVPFVASPTAPYRALSAEGAGIIATSPQQWRSRLTELAHADHWAEVQAAGREAAARLTIEAHADLWVDAWTRAATANQRSSAA